MSTYMPKGNKFDRQWYVIDAAGKPLGRVAAQVASVLRGKHKVTFTPHADCGDNVIVVNAGQAVLTGNKINKKVYQYHTGYIGHLKTIDYKDMMATNPDRAMFLAVKRMLPANYIGRSSLKRLKIYAGSTHRHEAQKPVELEYKG